MLPAGRRVEVLHVDEREVLVEEVASAVDELRRIPAEDLSKAFNETHEDVFAGDSRQNLVEVEGDLAAGDVVAVNGV